MRYARLLTLTLLMACSDVDADGSEPDFAPMTCCGDAWACMEVRCDGLDLFTGPWSACLDECMEGAMLCDGLVTGMLYDVRSVLVSTSQVCEADVGHCDDAIAYCEAESF